MSDVAGHDAGIAGDWRLLPGELKTIGILAQKSDACRRLASPPSPAWARCAQRGASRL